MWVGVISQKALPRRLRVVLVRLIDDSRLESGVSRSMADRPPTTRHDCERITSLGPPVAARQHPALVAPVWPNERYAVGATPPGTEAGFSFLRELKMPSGLRRAPPIARTAKPNPAMIRAMPTTTPNKAV
jgi:hypothetical protein